MNLKGTLTGIDLKPNDLALYKVEAIAPEYSNYFYFMFVAPRDAFDLDDKVAIAVEKQ